jgi:uncharacterized protein (TIGR03435 family)
MRMTWPKKLFVLAVALCVIATPIFLEPAKAAEQPAQAPVPKFEAVSIKPCPDPRQHQMPGDVYPPRGHSSPGRLRTGCFPLLDNNAMGLIRSAFADTFTPIDGGPSWIHSAFYEIDAIADGNPSVSTMMGPMMQVLLEDRFHLKIRRQTGEGPVYVLSAARGGPKLHSFTEGTCTPYSSPPPPLQPGRKYCEAIIGGGSPASIEDQGTTLDDFSKLLLGVLDRPVLNKTGITGRFDIHVEFSREGTKMAGMPSMHPVDGLSSASDSTGPPSIFTALEEQLGLKLESGKGPTEVLVIDHVERPSGN